MIKRLFDIVCSFLGLLACLPFFLLVALAVKAGGRGKVFFVQTRIGRGFKPFNLYKFRTMVEGAPEMGLPVTAGGDPRVTKVGRFLRKTKLDELPQLWNVLRGDMSLVGPRPEVRRYVSKFRDDFAEILKMRPGITDTASLRFRDEEALLEKAGNRHSPEQYYVDVILPEKIRLAKEYMKRASFAYDLRLICLTVLKLLSLPRSGDDRRPPRRIIVVGAGDAARMLLQKTGQPPCRPFNVIGFIDDDPRKKGLRIGNNIPVLGTRAGLKAVIKAKRPDGFLIAIPSATRTELEMIMKDLRRYGLPVMSMPSLGGLLTGRDSPGDIMATGPGDIFFGSAAFNLRHVRDFFGGKRVMVTGAAGPMGAELSRQVSLLNPERLVLFDKNQEGLQKTQRELRAPEYPPAALVAGDVCDEARLAYVMKRFRPNLILHTALYKRNPPAGEDFAEAFECNLRGTRILAEKARRFEAGLFALISTHDAAARLTGAAGMTIRAAEMMIESLGQGKKGAKTAYISVRTGDFFEGEGGAVSLLMRRITNGEPLEVGPPGMTHYFMPIDEAAGLVLEALAMGKGGEVFALRGGEPVRMLDLARTMVGLYGVETDIVFNWHEAVDGALSEWREKMEETANPRIFRTVSGGGAAYKEEINREDFFDVLLGLESIGSYAEIRAGLDVFLRDHGLGELAHTGHLVESG